MPAKSYFEIRCDLYGCPYLFSNLTPKLNHIAPNIPLIVQENFTRELVKKLHHGELDAIFIALRLDEKSIVVKALYDEPLVVLAPKKHLLAQSKAVRPKDLANETLLLHFLQWHRFEPDSPLHSLIKTVPHVAFKVNNLAEAIKDEKRLLEP